MTTLAHLAATALLTSAAASLVIISTSKFHGRLTFDRSDGVQKVHSAPTPRVGGVAIALALISATLLLPREIEARSIALCLGLASLPAVLVGLWEDLAKNVRPAVRLCSHFISAGLLVIGGGYVLRHSGFDQTDQLLQFTPLAVVVSIVCVAGVTNAVNLIDGYNGLAPGSVVIMSLGLAILSARIGDSQVFMVAVLLAAAVAGFLFLNFPFGKIFLGDAGAYLCGFALAALVLVLAVRHPGLSPWVPLLIIIYPVWEVLVSMKRRLGKRGRDPSKADRAHLHHLVARSISRPLSRRLKWAMGSNSLTAVALWPLPLLASLIALNVEMTSVNALLGIVVFQAFYERIYRITRIKKPSASSG